MKTSIDRSEEIGVRRAEPSDADEVVRLVSLMYETMGVDTSTSRWRSAAMRALRDETRNDLAVLVVDDPTGMGRLAATGAAIVATRLPGPRNLDARVGYIQWVATDPSARRMGFARAITGRLLDWLFGQGVGSVELLATPAAELLYRSFGFSPGEYPALRLDLS